MSPGLVNVKEKICCELNPGWWCIVMASLSLGGEDAKTLKRNKKSILHISLKELHFHVQISSKASNIENALHR